MTEAAGPYAYYFARLAGRTDLLPILDQPQLGFYRDRDKAIAYFMEAAPTVDDQPPAPPRLRCVEYSAGKLRDLSDVQALERWPFCGWNAVAEEEWRVVANGGQWPDEAPGLGHNQGPPLTADQERARAVDAAETWLKATPEIATQTQADQAADFITKLRHMVSDLKNEEQEAKKPYRSFIETIAERYRAWRDPVEAVGIAMKARLQPFLEAKAAAERAERERIHAENRARAAAGARPSEHRPPTARAGKTGSAVTLRTVRSAEITNYLLALDCAATQPEVQEAVQKIANRMAARTKDDMTEEQIKALLLPGTKLKLEQRV